MNDLPERARRAGRALAELGGSAAPGDVGRGARLDSSGQARALKDLKAAGLAEGNKALVRLTSAGWDLFLERSRPDAGALDEALSFWPYRHRAFLELLLSAVVARHHLAELRGPHLGGFMAIGATATGKSSMGEVACHLLGLDPVEHTLLLPEQTEGSVRGRRVQTAEGWDFSPAPALALPFVVFDEFDKADEPIRRAVFPYFHGRLDQTWEGKRLRYCPTPMVAANPPRGDRYGQLRGEYRRRAVVLDTGDSRSAFPGLEEGLRAFFTDERRWWRLLRLEELVPPVRELPAGYLNLFRTLPHVLTDEGRDLYCGDRPLELATLGRAGLLGAEDDATLIAAAVATSHDYLACMESVPGLVDPGWPQRFEALRQNLEANDVDVSSFEAALARRRSELGRHADLVRVRRQVEASEDLELVRARAELVAGIKGVLEYLDGRRLPPHHRVRAAGLKAQLTQLRDDASHARSAVRLAEIGELARSPLQEALDLRNAVDRERRDEEDRARAEREAAREARAARRRHPANRPSPEQRRAWDARLKAVKATARPLERWYERTTTKKDEDVLAQLAGYRLPEEGQPLLRYHAPQTPAPDPNRSRWDKFLDRLAGPPSGTWRSEFEPEVGYSGSLVHCAALAAWGPATREILRPVLAQLHQIEDELTRLLGRKARAGRPAVPRQRSTPAPASNVVPIQRPAAPQPRALPAAPQTALPGGSPFDPFSPYPRDPWSA